MSAAAVAVPQFPTMVPQMVSRKRIISVCPLPRYKTIPIGGMLFPFHIPAQPRDGYHILEVADTYTLIRTGFSEETEAGVHLAPAPIPARVLAESLVREWNMSLSNVGSLGLMVLPDNVEEGTPEFKAILATLTAQVREVAEWAIREAYDLHGNNKSAKITNGFHRALAPLQCVFAKFDQALFDPHFISDFGDFVGVRRRGAGVRQLRGGHGPLGGGQGGEDFRADFGADGGVGGGGHAEFCPSLVNF